MRWPVLLIPVLLLAACGGGDDDSAGDLRDGVHFGFVTALDPARFRLVFDEAELLEGEEAAIAARDDGSATTPGGRYVRNEEQRVERARLSRDLVVRLVAERCCALEEVPFPDWLDGFEPGGRRFYGTASSHYELTVEDEKVVLVEEVVVD